jgi:hypothetical protein
MRILWGQAVGQGHNLSVSGNLGVHRHQVALKRRQLGIANSVIQNERRRTPQRITKLGKVPDREIAQEM